MKRLPSFNDFSPKIIGDIRRPLLLLQSNSADFSAAVDSWNEAFFSGTSIKRAKTNITATLTNTGLLTRQDKALTDIGLRIANASSAEEAIDRVPGRGV